MSNTCACPNPPGGSVTCSDDQLAVCGYQDGQVVSGCFDRPQRVRQMEGTPEGRLALANWVISKITGVARPDDSGFESSVVNMLLSGRYANDRGEVLTFSVPKDLAFQFVNPGGSSEHLASIIPAHTGNVVSPKGRPLDKQEAVLYGKFVNAAYAMFKRDPNILHPEPATGDIPVPYELVAWVIMSDFTFWGKEIPKFYGLICQHQQQKRNFILAIRGTEGAVEWFDDAIAFLVPFRQVPNAGRVARGFDKIYTTLKVVKRHGVAAGLPAAQPSTARTAPEVMQGTFAEQLERLADTLEAPDVMSLAKERRPRRSFAVTGHSLGSALATLFVIENKEKNKFDINTVCTFASPHVGNTEFVNQFNQLPLTSWRIVNTEDIVPKLPLRLPLFDYQHVGTEFTFSSAGLVKGNPGCRHSMCTYLHWIDPNNIQVDDNCKA